ncbi:transcriptional regulator, TraR/DksA family [Magnetococcus marinus MC-1]|uniref:RNA polymerase-binding transcription factor DksA n=1 Tax=Magnetococcus marinus (strain ATCC BAA-1437 / JCM 17883 / MC-1) TaxID=156889 RepID=A0LCU1_MAGMM|nr:RNA polymerase-binding protein DksA [Magnetococcus marinus]ABK45784.1 transcriptional regulator, TraR/DksA family [Magnetococcus marinus MC-1]
MSDQGVAEKKIADIILPEGYTPSEDEEYMCEMQRAFFRHQLLIWKQQLVEEAEKTVLGMHEEKAVFADPTDRASLETDRNFELRTRDRERKLIGKIDRTIRTIEEDEYGFCSGCGVEIGLGRLQARPVTDLCIDCKTKEEQMERVHRDEDESEEE